MKIKKQILFVFAFLVGLFIIASVSANCFNEIKAKTTASFFAEIPSLNSKLASSACDNNVPIFKNEKINFQIFMQDGSKKSFRITILNKKFASIEEGFFENANFVVGIGQCEFETFLRSSDKAGTFAYLFKQKKVIIGGHGFWNAFRLAFIKPALGILCSKIQVSTNIACSNEQGQAKELKKAGQVCLHGGECASGNCVGVGQGPPWTYECSCDPYRFVGGDENGDCKK